MNSDGLIEPDLSESGSRGMRSQGNVVMNVKSGKGQGQVGAGYASVVMRRPKLVAIGIAMALAVLLVGPLHGNAYAASNPAVNQCNGVDNVGGQAIACTVAVVNTVNLTTGVTTSSVTGTVCEGAAHAPLTCTPWADSSNQLTSSVTQCNGSGSGGGGTVACSVSIVNNITGSATPTAVTVNQCNSSAEGGGTQPTLSCNPIGSTTGAGVTQCNGSGNGGGGTMRVLCTVDPSTKSSAAPTLVNQCVGSGNGGGSTVTCTSSEANHVIASGGTGGSGSTGGTGSAGGTGGTTGSGGAGASGTTGTGTGTGSGAGASGTGSGTGIGNGLGTVSKVPSSSVPVPPGGAVPSPLVPTGKLASTGANTLATVELALMAFVLGGALVGLSRRSIRRLARLTPTP